MNMPPSNLKLLDRSALAMEIELLSASHDAEALRAWCEAARVQASDDPALAAWLANELVRICAGLGELEARALRARGIALRAMGEWQLALDSLQCAERAAADAGDPLLAAQTLIAATDTLAQLGRRQDALDLAASLEARFRELGSVSDTARVIWNAGNIHFRSEGYADAGALWQRALEMFEATPDTLSTALLRMNLANVLTHLNRRPEALEAYRAARGPLEAAGRELHVANLDGNLGFLLFMGGRYTEALTAYRQARKRFEKLGLAQDLAQCDRETADVYLELNLVPEALEVFERVIPFFSKAGARGEEARAELGLASAHAAALAEAAADAALDRAERLFGADHNRVGILRAQLQRAERQRNALRSLPQGVAAPEREQLVRTARAIMRGFLRQSVRFGALQARLLAANLEMDGGGSPISRLLAMAREAREHSLITLLWRIEASLGQAWRDRGARAASLRHYRLAVEAVERLRMLLQGDDFRAAFVRDKTELYEELVALLLDSGTEADACEAFQLTERAKSRTLLERLAGARIAAAEPSPERIRLLDRLEQIRAALRWDYSRLCHTGLPPERFPAAGSASAPIAEMERDYMAIHRDLQWVGSAPETSPMQGISIERLRNALGPDEQLIEYYAIQDELMAFVVTVDSIHVVRCIGSLAEAQIHLHRLRFQWQTYGYGDTAARHGEQLLASLQHALGELYSILIEPIERLLTRDAITIVPHGPLHGLPFQALFDGEQYVIDRWEVAYAPSSGVLVSCHELPEPIGAPSLFIGVGSEGIEHVAEEIDALARIMPDALILRDEEATLSAVPQRGIFSYLHFATHAVFRNDNPLFSGLQLADGWLIANDLSERSLICSLATLSACRTGLGADAPGDELFGLARGFLAAGARAVAVSFWAANDEATALLMPRFYSELMKGESRAAALRTAQLECRLKFPDPYYWAAFALVGAR